MELAYCIVKGVVIWVEYSYWPEDRETGCGEETEITGVYTSDSTDNSEDNNILPLIVGTEVMKLIEENLNEREAIKRRDKRLAKMDEDMHKHWTDVFPLLDAFEYTDRTAGCGEFKL